MGGGYYNGQPAVQWVKRFCHKSAEEEEEEKEEEREDGQETDLSNLALQLFDCVKFPLPAVLRGHLVLPASSDIATQLHLRKDRVKFCSRSWILVFSPDRM